MQPVTDIRLETKVIAFKCSWVDETSQEDGCTYSIQKENLQIEIKRRKDKTNDKNSEIVTVPITVSFSFKIESQPNKVYSTKNGSHPEEVERTHKHVGLTPMYKPNRAIKVYQPSLLR
jgi:hypothetical protein